MARWRRVSSLPCASSASRCAGMTAPRRRTSMLSISVFSVARFVVRGLAQALAAVADPLGRPVEHLVEADLRRSEESIRLTGINQPCRARLRARQDRLCAQAPTEFFRHFAD